MELTLQQLFGANAYQDSQILVISKSDFSLSELSSAEAWFAAIINNARKYFNGYITGNNEFITSENFNFLDYDNSSAYNANILYKRTDLVIRNGVSYKIHKFQVKFISELLNLL